MTVNKVHELIGKRIKFQSWRGPREGVLKAVRGHRCHVLEDDGTKCYPSPAEVMGKV
jgi:hypothetical protein